MLKPLVEQRLKWLHKVLAIEVEKQLKLEAVRPSLHEGTWLSAEGF